jgi:putative toxin-antitoxin system antitoxin component (TIGR02293 family)
MTATIERTTADITELIDRINSGHREGHFYAALFGFRKYDALSLTSQIKRGFTYAALERFLRNTELSLQTLAQLADIPERTLARRKAAGRLESGESDRLARIARVFARATELFEGNVEGARTWLLQPLSALGGRSPLEYAKTDAGAIEVNHLIGRLEHGIPV